jgi:hypothetical protein
MTSVGSQVSVRALLVLLAVAVAVPIGRTGAQDKDKPKENKNTLIATHRKTLKLSASSEYPTFRADRLIDGKKETSWFSADDDSVAKGGEPWVQVTFPEDVKVSRVTVLGNREPSYKTGYSVLVGKIEFLAKNGKVLWTEKRKGAGASRDFDFTPKKPIDKVRSVKFSSVEDEGDQNGSGDVALAEILIE